MVCIIAVVCWCSANSIIMIKQQQPNKRSLSAHGLLTVAPGGNVAAVFGWRCSAPAFWKGLFFIQDAVARPAGCSLTAFWQSNITSSWAWDNHPLSRTLSYLSRLEALHFYHAHAVFFPSFLFFPRLVGFFSLHVLFIYRLYTEFKMTPSASAGCLKTGGIIWCGSPLLPHPDR